MSGHLPPERMWVPGGHRPFDYTKLADLTDLRNALVNIREDIELAIDGIDKADLKQTLESHMQATMVLSGLEIKMTNFAEMMRKKFLV